MNEQILSLSEIGATEGMTEAQIIALVQSMHVPLDEFSRNPFRVYTDPTMNNEVLVPGFSWTYGPQFPGNVVDTGHGINTIRCHGEEYQYKRPGSMTTDETWRFRHVFAAYISMTNRNFGSGKTSPTQFVGIGCGYPTGVPASVSTVVVTTCRCATGTTQGTPRITRSSGDFIADGVVPGMIITGPITAGLSTSVSPHYVTYVYSATSIGISSPVVSNISVDTSGTFAANIRPAGPPWPDPPDADFVQLRMRGDIQKWELVSGPAGTAATVVPLVGVEDPSDTICQLAMFDWNPTGGPSGGPILKAYVNGVLGATISDPGLLPAGDVQSPMYNNWFACGGDPRASFPNNPGYVTLRIGPMFMQEFGVITP